MPVTTSGFMYELSSRSLRPCCKYSYSLPAAKPRGYPSSCAPLSLLHIPPLFHLQSPSSPDLSTRYHCQLSSRVAWNVLGVTIEMRVNDKHSNLTGCYTVSIVKNLPTFGRIIAPLYIQGQAVQREYQRNATGNWLRAANRTAVSFNSVGKFDVLLVWEYNQQVHVRLWIYYIRRKPPICFGHLLWPSLGRCCTKDILQITQTSV